MPESLGISHIALPCRDPKMMSEWYQNVFGFKANGRNLMGKGTVLTILKGTPLPNDDWHFGFLLSSVESLLEWQQHLRSKGLNVSDVEGDAYYRAIRLQDPEGNDLELFWEPSALKEAR